MRRAGSVVPVLALAALTACSEGPTTIERDAALQSAEGQVKYWEVLASVDWNARANDMADLRAIDQARLFSYLSLAQYRAAQAALEVRPHAPVSAAIGGASAVVLAHFFPSPAEVASIEAALDAQEAATPWPGAKHANFAAGEALGRAVAAEVLAFAAGDRVGLTDPGQPPPGDSVWSSAAGMARGNFMARPFYLTSPDEFRPPPPPSFSSPEYQAALAEVKSITQNRTPADSTLAVFWHIQNSARRNTVFNRTARDLIVKYHRSDAEAARILATMNTATFDALVACFNTKYHYWMIRPTQADPSIVIPVGMGLPPHPSYPSAHSCISGSNTEVLAREFPPEREMLEALANEAGFSRVIGGLHYRFDSEVGLQLGRQVGAKAWALGVASVDITP